MPRILAIDYGKKRSGIAVTDPLKIIATALETIDTFRLLDFLKKYAQKETVEAIVIGMPRKLDNSDTHATAAVISLIAKIKNIFPEIPVHSHDERYTSRMAMQSMIMAGTSKKNRQEKGNIDMVSATIILQSFMECQGI